MANRTEVLAQYKWNIEAMYPDESDWDKDSELALKRTVEFEEISGHLNNGPEMLLNALKLSDLIWQTTEKVYVYARMKKDEDNNNSKYQAMNDKAQTLIAKVSASMSWFTPELLSLDPDVIDGYLKEEPALHQYDYLLKVMARKRAHVLSKEEENLLAQFSEVLGATSDVFTMINDADMKFEDVVDKNGNHLPLSHGTYIKYMEDSDRNLRIQAYEHMYDQYIAQKNTLATTYSYNAKVDALSARVRKYDSALAQALAADNVPADVYDSLIASVNDNLDSLYKYMDTRKKSLGVDELKMYDIYVPLVELEDDAEVSFDDAVAMMLDALSVLGEDYIANVSKGVQSGWIDRFENDGKSSGAYSFGSYDSMPYILMNYSGKLKDVFTLVHEMGHSMHSHYTRSTQPFVYGSHSIFTAEVASTVNECLLIHYLLEKYKDDAVMKKYLINLHIEEFRATLFRQTMFAEFEKRTHEAVETGEVLTSEWLCAEYKKLNEKYFGPLVESDERISHEWSRIPHFYRAFYVYKYATGYSAATAIAHKILNEGQPAVDAYLEFLKSGDSDDPIELLKLAGVDMSGKEPVDNALKVFADLVDEFAAL
ncbi:MAG: oligoendopeptidase F [Clostridiales Family XIII bacterium]|jgi:oligoendopeptidase F|nr:oligoendopeptidase F [Clostridiales Family XIII bacterium]